MIPFFSIIMPTKNRAGLIDESIQSIIDQKFDNWELLVIDDHSSDNTENIVKIYSDERIKYHKLLSKTGPGAARNFAIKKLSEGKIIVIADSDDLSTTNRLDITYETFSTDDEIDVVYGNIETIGLKSELIKSCPFDKELLKQYNFIFNSNAAFKKDLFLKTKGYDESLTNSEDYDLWLSFLELDAKFFYIDKVLTKYRVHSDSQTRKIEFNTRKNNLAYVRKKHKLTTPNADSAKKIIPEYIWERINQKRGVEFWFTSA